MDTQLDLSQMTTITTVNPRGSGDRYDLRYSDATNKFMLSEKAFLRLNIANQSVTMHVHPAGHVLLSLHEIGYANASFFTGRNGSNTGREFTARRLREELNNAGLKGQNMFAITPAGTHGGAPVFLVKPWGDEREESPLTNYGVQNGDEGEVAPEIATEVAPEAPAETPTPEASADAPADETTPEVPEEAKEETAEEVFDF